MKNFIKVETNPVLMWINLVKRWNDCVDAVRFNMNENERNHKIKNMILVKAEAHDLMEKYPGLNHTVKLYNELSELQMDTLKYGDYHFEYELPNDCPKPLIIGEFKLIE